MLLKNIVYGLLLGFFCLTVSPLHAGKKKALPGPTQYRASSEQVFELFSTKGLDSQGSWSAYKAGQIDLNGLKEQINLTFDNYYKFLEQRSSFELFYSEKDTVFNFLVKCFGSCAPEHKWIKKETEKRIALLNDQSRKNVQAEKKTFYKWQRSAEWSNCYANEAAQVLLEKIKETIFSFLDTMQEYQDVPEFWIVVTSIKAGKEFKLLTECVIDPVMLATMKLCNQAGEDFNQGAVTGFQDEGDHWENVQLSANCPVKAFMLAAGVAIVTYGIIESCCL